MFKSSDAPVYAEERSQKSQGGVETVVGPSVVVEGDFSSEGNILVKGTVSGNVKTSTLLTVESGARILANVKAGDALISGEVKGNVRCSGSLELTESARILGDITCKVLVVAAGAMLHGKVTMKGIEKEEIPKGHPTTGKKAAPKSRSKKTEQQETDEAVA